MAKSDKQYYWLKLKRDFFKRHDIQIIEAMPNGKDYILFYLKLLCESVDHEGNLRFSDEIPYNENMLSVITNTNIDVLRSAVKIFTDLKMMEIMDDGTYFMREVEKMIGTSKQDEHTRESTRLRVQAYRERQKELPEPEDRYSNVTCNGELKIDIDKEIDIDKDLKTVTKVTDTRSSSKPKKTAYGSLKNVMLTKEEYAKLKEKFVDADDKIEAMSLYFESHGNASKYKSHYATALNWARMAQEKDAAKQKTQPKQQNKTAWEILKEKGLV